jgi:hypothetical protein
MMCLACGPTSSTASGEHVFSAWLLKYLAAKEIRMATFRVQGNGTEEPHRIEIALDKFRSKRTCENCNNGWMSRLEANVMNSLKGLLDGTRSLGSLTEHERQLLAKWAGKTAIIESHAIGAEHPVNPRFLRWMKENDSTPGNFAFAACQRDFGGIGHLQVGAIKDLIGGGIVAANIIVLTLPSLAFVCAFPFERLSYDRCLCDLSLLTPLWPVAAAWRQTRELPPLGKVEGSEGLLVLAERIELYHSFK